MPERLTVDVAKTAGEISPLWFGHNLEHTRSCIWQGLSAQLVANRKFAGMPQHDGVAAHWYRIGPRESWCLLEMFGGYKATDGEPFTAHYDPRNGQACQRQRIECFRSARCGIGQRGIPLVKGRKYVARLALRADRELAVSVRLAGEAPRGPWRLTPRVILSEAKDLSGACGQGTSAPRVATRATQTGKSARRAKPARVGAEHWTELEFAFTAPATTADARLEITFQGPGVLYVGMASLLPADHFHGMRRDVVALLQEIGVPILRWPGGNFAGDYRWQDGLLPVDRRAPLQNAFIETLPHTDGYDAHEIGTDEFIALCRELGAEPFLTLNLSLEGVDEAAAWVEYCNGGPETKWGRLRAERGHPEPYNVRQWTLGNEMGYSHMKGPHAPKDYGALAAACARAMRAVDPSLRFTSSTGWGEAWYQGLLASEEDYYDTISHHTYNTLMRHFDGEAGAAEFRHLARCPEIIFHTRARGDGYTGETRLTMLDIRGLINESPRRDKGVGIAFDEWNVWYAWYREPGVAEGIYAALMLNELARESRRLGVAIGCYFEPVNEGAILVEPGSARLTPVGQAHAFFKPHHGAQLLEVARSHKRLARGDGSGSDAPDEADLDVAASVRPETGQLTITIVNRSPDGSRRAELCLQNAAPRKVEGVLLSSDSYRPGSVFRESRLKIERRKTGALAVALPPHSVARITCSASRR